jgi:hypothetical protein
MVPYWLREQSGEATLLTLHDVGGHAPSKSFDKIAPVRALHRVPTFSGALVKLFKALRNSLRRHSKQHRYLVTSFAIVDVAIGYTTSACLQRRFSAARGIAGGAVNLKRAQNDR